MDDFIKRWDFVRSETLEILSSLSDKQLLYRPEGVEQQPLYYQFACIARTQVVYSRAVETGTMDFSLFGSEMMPGKHDYQTKSSLGTFLDSSNKEWLDGLKKGINYVNWNGEQKSIGVHIMSLAEHERMHHGQIISYFTIAGYHLPKNFKSNWAL